MRHVYEILFDPEFEKLKNIFLREMVYVIIGINQWVCNTAKLLLHKSLTATNVPNRYRMDSITYIQVLK